MHLPSLIGLGFPIPRWRILVSISSAFLSEIDPIRLIGIYGNDCMMLCPLKHSVIFTFHIHS